MWIGETEPPPCAEPAGSWQRWTPSTGLCSTKLSKLPWCRSAEVYCAGHLHKQNDPTKARSVPVLRAPALFTQPPESISLPAPADQSPAVSEHPEVSVSAHVEPSHCWNHWRKGSTAVVQGQENHLPFSSSHIKPAGTTLKSGLPCRPQAQPSGTRPLQQLSQQTPNQGLRHCKVTDLSKCWTLQAVCSSHYPQNPFVLMHLCFMPMQGTRAYPRCCFCLCWSWAFVDVS